MRKWALSFRWLTYMLLSVGLLLGLTSQAVQAEEHYLKGTGPVVIYEVYGAGGYFDGYTAGLYNNDYVVLKNVSAADVSLEGWSLQYAMANRHFGKEQVNLSGTIAPNGYYLIKLFGGGHPSQDLPREADVVGDIPISKTNFKLALVGKTDTITNSDTDKVVDFIGTANSDDHLKKPAMIADISYSLQRVSYTGDNSADYHQVTPNLDYLLPEQTLSEARQVSTNQKLRTTGIVTHMNDAEVIIQDDEAGMVLQLSAIEPTLKIGDQLDVIGTRQADANGTWLAAKTITIRASDQSLPEPVAVTLEALHNDPGAHDARRVHFTSAELGRFDASMVVAASQGSINVPLHLSGVPEHIDAFDLVDVVGIVRQDATNYIQVVQKEDLTLVTPQGHPSGIEIILSAPETVQPNDPFSVNVELVNNSTVDLVFTQLEYVRAGQPDAILLTETTPIILPAGSRVTHTSAVLVLNGTGAQNILIRAHPEEADPYEAQAEVRVQTIPEEADVAPPVISGVRDRTVKRNASFEALAGISATDAVDGNVAVTAEPAQINTRKAGTITVTLTATDRAGNQAVATYRVTVMRPKPAPSVTPGGGNEPAEPVAPAPPEPDPPYIPQAPDTPDINWENPFTDVAPEAWYFDTVRTIVTDKWMVGTSSNTFAPDATTTRAMVVALLHRANGTPLPAQPARFTDVAADAWYAEPVAWAQASGLAGGYNAHAFGPDDAITREQFTAFLMKDAAIRGLPTGKRSTLSAFKDANQVVPWAAEAVSWAVAEGLLHGRPEGALDPAGPTTRAEAAALFLRYQTYLESLYVDI